MVSRQSSTRTTNWVCCNSIKLGEKKLSTYKETLKWIFSKLPMYQRRGAAAYRSGLDSIKLLDLYLGHPHKNFKSIHIAGTNGKGSTSHMIALYCKQQAIKRSLHFTSFFGFKNALR
ncbi:MAG: hypothetical protein CM15mP122_0140 [Bacteroidota bacterium]|nr:MAG: hypothetical protein CM15mP122_0140 [Bacteroidota bacterium]